ncbi:hypothetical protein KGQ71_01505 [Patescibacteria group bacterium]|nr:hypothetical protein [Patescibacteria group bacterium]
MDNTHTDNGFDPNKIVVSQEEVDRLADVLESKYDTQLDNPKIIELAKLAKELRWWQSASNKSAITQSFVDETMGDLKDILEIFEESAVERQEDPKDKIEIVPYKEMERVVNKMRWLIADFRRVSFEGPARDKLAKLLREHYEVELDANQLDNAILLLSRKLWYMEGLDKDLATCLDDLLSNGSNNKHPKIHEAIKITVQKFGNRLV